jgi:hypothetical protein
MRKRQDIQWSGDFGTDRLPSCARETLLKDYERTR